MSDEYRFRIAEAIYNSDYDDEPSQPFRDRDLDLIGSYLNSARTAIEAMREPTLAMEEEGSDYKGFRARTVWQAMIDEALK